MKKLLLAACAALSMAAVTPANAATLIIEEGILTGATGVDVGGSFYDVSFRDGTCADVFGGCDSQSDFAFNSFQAATVAANSLLNQVFLGTFDDNPALTRGCTSTTVCAAIIPYTLDGRFLSGATSFNSATGAGFDDGVGSIFTSDFNITEASIYNWARFSLTGSAPVAAVPEPATWLMMLLGFAGVGFSLRRKKATTGPMQLA